MLQKRKTLTLKHKIASTQISNVALQDAIKVQNKTALKIGADLDREARARKMMRIKTTLTWLCTMFPQVFDDKRSKALKTKIEQDIFSLIPTGSEITKSATRQAISFYVNGKDYFQTVLNSSHRIDLNGTECEEVTERQKQYSRERMQVLMDKIAKRKAKRASQSSKQVTEDVR